MADFVGEYDSTVDSKNRFLLPGGIKKDVPEGEIIFVINRGFEDCLNLYTLKDWKIISAEINTLNQYDPKVRELQRRFNAGATKVEFDSAGRLLIPQTLKEFAELQKDITLVAIGNRIEIWDSKKYKKFFENFSAQDFSKLAEDVMVKKKNNNE